MTTRPLKQGGLATQQADVAAGDIARLAGADVEVEPYRPVLRGLLLTGEEAAADRSSPPEKIVGRHLEPYLAGLGG
jgi:sulfide:quinone oxidoreductase